VWYDALSIGWGDSLRAKIDDGLKKSKFGIVVLSKDYIRKALNTSMFSVQEIANELIKILPGTSNTEAAEEMEDISNG